MSKLLTSPVSEYAGTVTIPERLTTPQYLAYKRTLKAIQDAGQDYDNMALATIEGMLAIVEKWEIAGLENPTLDAFPVTPILPAIKFLMWLFGEITAVVMPAEQVPNE